EGAQSGSRGSRRHAVGLHALHARLGGFSGREPPFDFGDVALWITCERPETSGAAECVLALWPLEGEALFALLADVHDHVAEGVGELGAPASAVRVRTACRALSLRPRHREAVPIAREARRLRKHLAPAIDHGHRLRPELREVHRLAVADRARLRDRQGPEIVE